MKKITIIDYGCGNILSLRRGIQEVGYTSEITNDRKKIINSDFIILPGVGAFQNAMNLLDKNNLVDTLREYVLHKKKKILGICLGMQVFLTKSYEMGEHKGLNFIEGEVVEMKKFTKLNNLKVPHISWNEIFINENAKNKEKINQEILNKDYYFVHSYLAITKKKEDTLAYSSYFDLNVPAILNYENILGCQFHPEKSGKNGLHFLKKVLEVK
jgi:glutamine amidotransferase